MSTPRPFKKINILVDNDSWILPYAKELKKYFSLHYQCKLIRKESQITEGDVCFLLGCTKLVSQKTLNLNKYNLVIHESDLPKNKGFAPMAWQILGKNRNISVCLLEAAKEADSGDIWIKETINLSGFELHDEWRSKQAEITIKMAKEFIENFEQLSRIPQTGLSSFNPRRTQRDSELDINKTIDEQFDLLRVVSNNDYPAFFIKDGIKYKLEIHRYDK